MSKGSRRIEHGVKVSYEGFDVNDLDRDRSKEFASNKAFPNLLSSLALPYLYGAKKQVERYKKAATLLPSNPILGVMECLHEASNLFEDLNTVVVYVRKCGKDHRYHELWQAIRNHIRHAIREEFDKDDDDLKNKRAQYLGLNSKLQTSIGFERDVIKIAKKEVKVSEIEDYLDWAEEVISGILTEARKEGFLKKE